MSSAGSRGGSVADLARGATELLRRVAGDHVGRIAFATSLGAEDQVITDLIARTGLDIPLFTLDTGRLFPETYDLIDRTESHYGIRVRTLVPDAASVESMVAQDGVNLFLRSRDLRLRCCEVRKVVPLRRALTSLDAWICGLRQEQSVTRANLEEVGFDEVNGLARIAPLARWSGADVWTYIREREVPYNSLHDRGFPSIGCAPCTRAVVPGDDPRSGRWWWELPEQRECGLHSQAGAEGGASR